MKADLADLIRKNALLSEEQLREALSYFKPLTARKNELLLEEGIVADKLFFITKGCLRLSLRE